MSFNNVPAKGNRWQDSADKSVLKDGEKGGTKRVSPPPDDNEVQDTPNGNGTWPYR